MVTEPPWLPRLPDADASEGGPGALLENRSPSLYLLPIPVCLSACLPLLPSLSPCLSLSLPPTPDPRVRPWPPSGSEEDPGDGASV